MQPEEDNPKTSTIIQQISNILKNPWLGIVNLFFALSEKISQHLKPQPPGLYEVLEYETTLEILDPQGKEATVHKHQKVRYLQDNIIAYQDQAWGDGDILIDYKCIPGVPVDRYRSGHKTHILISLREVKCKGDIDDFDIQWRWKEGFLTSTGFWGTRIDHKTKFVKVEIIFPQSRPPLSVFVTESNRKRTQKLGETHKKKLPDGRWMVVWQHYRPQLFETYLLVWEW